MYDSEQNERSSAATVVQDGMRFLHRRFTRIALTAIICAIVAVMISQSLDPRYRSTAELLIERVPVADPEDAQAMNAMDESSFVDGQVLVLQSSDLLRKVIEDANLLNDPEIAGGSEPSFLRKAISSVTSLPEAFGLGGGPEEDLGEPEDPIYGAIQRLRDMVTVLREGRSTVITVSVSANNPDKAARIANAITQSYIDRQTEVQEQRAEQVAARLNSRLTDLRQQLLAAEDAVETYKAQKGILSTDVGTLSEQQLSELNGQLVQTRADLFQQQAVLERAQNLRDNGGDIYALRDLMDSQLLSDLRARLLEATRREGELIGLLGESNPALDQVRAEMADLQGQIDAEIDRLVGMLSNEVDVTKAREALLLNALQQTGELVTSEGEGEVELRELERIATAYSSQYERLLERVGNAGELVGTAGGDVRVISPAVAANGAYFPPDKMIVALGLILGAGLGLLWSLARESMNTGLVTSQQTENALGVPVLSAIPQARLSMSPKELLLRQPDSSFAEAIRTLRHLTLAGSGGDVAPALLVTSSLSGEGRTTIATSLAISAAMGGQRVLLIDADLRHRALTQSFGLTGKTGLTDVTPEGSVLEQVVRRDKDTGIFLLPAGGPAASPPDLLDSARTRIILDWAKSVFDLVVVDSPEVGNRVDSIILTKHADLVLFVVRWSRTPADIVAECLGKLDDSKVRGVAINAVNEHEAANYGDSNARFARLQGHSRPGWRNQQRA